MPSFGYGVVASPPKTRGDVGLVLAEERDGRRAVGAGRRRQPVRPGARVVGAQVAPLEPDLRAVVLDPVAPGVAEPQRRQHVQGVGLRAAVGDGDPQRDVGRRGLGVRGLDLPVAVVVEGAAVEQLGLRLGAAAPGVLLDQPGVRELALRVVVAPLQPRVARGRVEVPPVVLGVLAVVALRPGQPEHPLLEDRVAAVPQPERQAEVLVEGADAPHAVLVPAVRARARVLVREEAPGVAVGAVVLAHRSPGALGQVRAPLVPGAGLLQAGLRPPDGLHALLLGVHADSLAPGGGARVNGRLPVDDDVAVLEAGLVRRQRAGLAPHADQLGRPARGLDPGDTGRPVEVLAAADREARVVPRALDDAVGVVDAAAALAQRQPEVRALVAHDADLVALAGHQVRAAADLDRHERAVSEVLQLAEPHGRHQAPAAWTRASGPGKTSVSWPLSDQRTRKGGPPSAPCASRISPSRAGSSTWVLATTSRSPGAAFIASSSTVRCIVGSASTGGAATSILWQPGPRARDLRPGPLGLGLRAQPEHPWGQVGATGEVVGVAGVRGDELRPQPVERRLVCDPLGAHPQALGPDDDGDVGVGDQVERPRGVLGLAEVRADQGEVVAVSDVHQRGDPLPGRTSRRCGAASGSGSRRPWPGSGRP